MKIRITKKHLKDADYYDHKDCPLARALKARKYTRVRVLGWTASAYKNGKKVDFNFSMYPSKIEAGKPFTVNLKILRQKETL